MDPDRNLTCIQIFLFAHSSDSQLGTTHNSINLYYPFSCANIASISLSSSDAFDFAFDLSPNVPWCAEGASINWKFNKHVY